MCAGVWVEFFGIQFEKSKVRPGDDYRIVG